MIRATMLDTAKQAVTVDRAATHGNAEHGFATIAALWSADMGIRFTATDVARLMVLLKIARAKANPGHADSWVDMAGYAACGCEIATEANEGIPFADHAARRAQAVAQHSQALETE